MPRIITVSAANSTVNASSLIPATNTPVTLTITVLDTFGNPVQGLAAARVVIAASGANNTVTQPTGVTDKDGVITGAYQGSTSGARTITVTVLGQALASTPFIVVGGTDVLLDATWENGTGSSYTNVLTDGGTFGTTYTCGNDPSTVLSVVAAGGGDPGTGGTFRVSWSGVESACGAVEARDYFAAGQSHYGRIWYRRVDDVFAGSNHNFSYNFVGDIQHVWFNPLGRGSGQWSWGIGAGRATAYPFRYWRTQTGATNPPPQLLFDCNVFYRFEWHLEFLDGGARFRNHPRLYTANGTTILADENDLYGEDTPFGTTLTLAEWYALGNSFDVENATEFRYIGLGNEGQFGHPYNTTMHDVRHLRLQATDWVGTAV